VFDLIVERLAGVLAQDRGDIEVQLRILARQRHDRDAEDWEDETQLSYMLSPFETQRIAGRGV
jgi:hypothetical protein